MLQAALQSIRFSLLILLFALQACSSTPQPESSALAQTVKQPIFLWQVNNPSDPQDPTFYLYGTMHFKTKEMAYLDKSVIAALKGADRLFLEVDPKETTSNGFKALIYQLGILPQSVYLKDQLPTALYRNLEQALDKKNITGDARNNVMKMRPWLAALTLETMNIQANGNQQQYGSEIQLSALADELKKPIAGLETAEFQIRIFAGSSKRAQEFQLQEAIDQILGTGKFAAQKQEGDILSISDLNAVYETGDYRKLDAFARKMAKDPQSRDFYKTVVADRNRGMAQKIAALSKDQKRSFAAIGALHFVGPDNILELLKKQGLIVKRVSPKGKVDQIFTPAAQASLPQSATGWVQVSTPAFDVSMLGQPVAKDEKTSIKDMPGQYIVTRTWSVENTDFLMMAVSIEYPSIIMERLNSTDPKPKMEVLKSLAHGGAGSVGRIKSTRIVDSPKTNSLLVEFEGDQAAGSMLVFEDQGRFTYLLSAIPPSRRQDPTLQANEKKFFKSLKLKTGS